MASSQTEGKIAAGPPRTVGISRRLRLIPDFGPRVGLPASEDPILQARSIAAFFIAGSAMVALSLLLPAPADRDEAVAELRRHISTQFDPEIVEAFLSTLSMTPATA
jgi:hypothetical protein